MKRSGILPVLFFTALCLTSVSFAEESRQGGEGGFPPPPEGGMNQTMGGGQSMGERRGLPQAAIDACAGKNEGASCECSGPRGTESGTCAYTPDKKYFACKPSGMGGGGQGQMQPPSGQGN